MSLRLIPISARVPRRKDEDNYELCYSCGFYIYEIQDVAKVPLGQNSEGEIEFTLRHKEHSDCRTSIHIGEPRIGWGPMRSRAPKPTSLQEQEEQL